MCMQTVLIASQDTELCRGLRLLLESDSTAILEAKTAKDTMKQMDDQVDLVILAMTLPDASGLSVCRELRRCFTAPILFIADTESEESAMQWLYAGGDDCFVKTYSYLGIVARIKALLRRYCTYKGKMQPGTTDNDGALSADGLRVLTGRNEVWKNGQELFLTELEYQLLRLLMQYPGRTLTAEYLYEKVWGEPYFPISNGTVMVHISNLRMKIEDIPQRPRIIKTVRGKGYRFEA